MIKNKHYQKLCEQQNKLVTDPSQSKRHLPSQPNLEEFTNGKPVPYDDYDAKDLQYNWKTHQSCRQRQVSLDFRKLNKEIIASKQSRHQAKQSRRVQKQGAQGSVTYDIMLPEFGH